jgi:hypothetical protein
MAVQAEIDGVLLRVDLHVAEAIGHDRASEDRAVVAAFS